MSAMGNGHSDAIRNPGKFHISTRLRTLFFLFTAFGIAAFVAGMSMDEQRRVWASFLINHFYFLCLALGGVFFAAINWVTGAMWSAPVRRISEAFTAYLPIALIMFVILCFGIHDLYIWSRPEHVRGDMVLEAKKSYLSVTFFIVRNLLALVLLLAFTKQLIGNSLKQDKTGDYALSLKNSRLSPVFLIIFGLSLTMMSFDLIMSLAPHWFSTIFGVYCFAGLFYSNLASTCLLVLYLRSRGHLEDIITENHLQDFGKYMFAFTIFWTYIGFSQFMLIWYANLPEETAYYLRRFSDGWLYVSWFLVVGKFAIPFFFLLPRDVKRNPKWLAVIGAFMLIAQWVDVMWMVQPEFFVRGPVFGMIELGVTLGFLGIFGLATFWFLGRYNIIAIGDPRLPESVFHHHQ